MRLNYTVCGLPKAFVYFASMAQAHSAIASIKSHMALFEGMNRVEIEQRSVNHTYWQKEPQQPRVK